MKKLTREDIKKYGTEEEKKFLKEKLEDNELYGEKSDKVWVICEMEGFSTIKNIIAVLNHTHKGLKAWDKIQKKYKGRNIHQYHVRLNDLSTF
jgi:hypothetical protein